MLTALLHSPAEAARWLTAGVTPALALTALALAAAPAAAQGPGLSRVGPINPANGFPMWYEDTNGIKLGICDDPNRCLLVLPNPLATIRFPAFNGDPAANFPDELFYYGLDTAMAGVNGARALYVCALEGAFGGGAVKLGDQIVFARIRLRVTNLVDGATYTVTHPYGVETLVAGDGGLPGEINMTRDVGIGAPGDFTGALSGDIGPFVTPVAFAGGPQGTYLSDAALTAGPVKGSPILVGGLPANFFRIEGPSVGLAFPGNVSPNPALGPDPTTTLDAVEIADFSVQGQISRQFGVAADKFHYLKTTTQTSVNVWASSASGQSLRASIDGGPTIALAENGTTGQYFVRAELGAAAVRPNSVTVINVSDNPPTQVARALPDLVTGTSALFTLGGTLSVNVASTDAVASPTLTAQVNNGTPVQLINQGLGVSVGSFGIPLGSIPPHTVRVTSAAGGAADIPVKVVGLGTFAGAATLIANAGPDQSVGTGALVSLTGAASIGPVSTFNWTHNAGALITLNGASTATPSFTAPASVAAPLSITFTLSIANADATLTAQDTVVVVVNPPPPADVLSVATAQYVVSKQKWQIRGTSSVLLAHTVSVYLGPVGNTSRKIGDAAVDNLGAWRLTPGDGSAVTSNTVPGAADTTIWAVSSLPGNPVTVLFQRK